MVHWLLEHPEVNLAATYGKSGDTALHLAGEHAFWNHKEAGGALRVFSSLVRAFRCKGILDVQVALAGRFLL